MKRQLVMITVALLIVFAGVVFAGSPSWLGTKQTDTQSFLSGYFKVVGRSASKQDEYAALRAAKVTAQRDLMEIIKGIRVSGNTEVKSGVLTTDEIRTAVEGMLQGATICENGEFFDEVKGTGYVCLEIGRKDIAGQMYSNPAIMDKIVAAVKPAPQFAPQEVKPVNENYDGLVIDLKAHNFRPALVNRIFTAKGDVIYDPSKISQQVLVESGCGDYSNTIDKAKAALETRGVKNPLIVKAIGVLSTTDARVSEDDAMKIFSANQNGGFLAGAKVAFVLK